MCITDVVKWNGKGINRSIERWYGKERDISYIIKILVCLFCPLQRKLDSDFILVKYVLGFGLDTYVWYQFLYDI